MVKVCVDIDEKHMNAIEDVFFCVLDDDSYEKMRPLLLEVWEQLCYGMGDKDDKRTTS